MAKPMFPPLQRLVQSIVVGAEALNSVLREIAQDEQFQQALRLIAVGVETVFFWDWVERACAHSGFLPYRTVPFDEFYRESKGNYELFSSLVSNYYESQQKDILQDIESRLETLEYVDADRKETLREAIMAHRCGLFRLTARALLPDIERIILEDWMGMDRQKPGKLSDKMICKIVKNKRLKDVTPASIYDFRLFGCLVDVLYKNGGKLKEFEGEDLPNRHAALHGWLPYSSKEYSLNTIVFADYILRLVPVLKENDE